MKPKTQNQKPKSKPAAKSPLSDTDIEKEVHNTVNDCVQQLMQRLLPHAKDGKMSGVLVVNFNGCAYEKSNTGGCETCPKKHELDAKKKAKN